MIRTTFLKPICEKEEGEMCSAIIAYKKIPWIIEAQTHKDTQVVTEKIKSYKYYLHINLWFILIYIDWIFSNEKEINMVKRISKKVKKLKGTAMERFVRSRTAHPKKKK